MSDAPDAPELVCGAFVANDLIGAAGLMFEQRERTKHKATLFGMYVRPAARGQGVAKLLVGEVLRQASLSPFTSVVQLTVSESSAAAIGLYARCGFVPFGTEPFAVKLGKHFTTKLHMWREVERSPLQLNRTKALVEVTFRQSTTEEWSSAHELTQKNMANYYAASDRTWDTNTFRDSWPTTENFTLEHSGTTVGYMRLYQSDGTLWVRDIQVVKAAQGQGVGSFALSIAERIAQERGASTLRLRVFDTNPAIRLYMRQGFRRIAHDSPLLILEKSAAYPLHAASSTE